MFKRLFFTGLLFFLGQQGGFVGPGGGGDTLPVQAGVSICPLYPGSTVDAKVNACIADAINTSNGNTTGIADASGFTDFYASVAEIDAGNSGGAAGELVLPCTGSWQGSMTDGTSDTLKQFTGFDVVTKCPIAGMTANFYIGATGGSNVKAIWEVVGTANQYLHASGFEVLNSAGHTTASHYTAIIDGGNFAISDGSAVTNVNINDFDNPLGGGLLLRNICCGFAYYSSAFNSNGGGIPVTIQAYDSPGSGIPGSFVQKISFISDTMVDPGVGKPVLSCTDTRSGKDSYVDFDHGYTETNGTDTAGNLVSSTCQQLTFSHYGVYSNKASNAQQWASTASGITLDDIHFYAGVGTWIYPVTVEPGATTDTAGNYGLAYPSTFPSSLGPLTTPSLTGPSTAPSGSCTTNGQWVFSKDGHGTFCASGTWTTKI